MSSNRQIEPFEESSSRVDLSSNENDLESEQTEIPEISHPPEHSETPDIQCAICLENVTNKCHTESCWHLFCFKCLKRWSKVQPSCPLCKNRFQTIRHSLNTGMGITYQVPPILGRRLSPSLFDDDLPDGERLRVFRMNLFLDILQRNERLLDNIRSNRLNNPNNQGHNHNSGVQTNAQQFLNYPRNVDPYGPTMRMQVYIDNMWAEPLPDAFGQFIDGSLAFYRNNPEHLHILYEFVVRDVTAIRSIRRTEDINRLTDYHFDAEYITNMVLRSVSLYEIRDSAMTVMLRPYLGVHAAHFCHELYNFASSPFNVNAYDSYVRYSNPQSYFFGPMVPFQQRQPGFSATGISVQVPIALPIPSIFNPRENIVLDSDDDIIQTGPRRFTEEIIVISSTSEDSDVEITDPTDSSHSIEVHDSSYRDQPSTSTGIRDSLDQTINIYNRFNLRRPAFILPTELPRYPIHPVQLWHTPSLIRERTISDSSSSDESITSNRDSQGVKVNGRRKRKIKKSQHKKRKTNSDDTQPEILGTGTRSRSYSGSSSSSGDTDSSSNDNNSASVQTNSVM